MDVFILRLKFRLVCYACRYACSWLCVFLCHSFSHPFTLSNTAESLLLFLLSPSNCFCRDNKNISDLWEHQGGLRKAIKSYWLEVMSQHVLWPWFIWLASVSLHHSTSSLLPEPHPCCSVICTPIKKYCSVWCRVAEATLCWICLSVYLFKCKSSFE